MGAGTTTDLVAADSMAAADSDEMSDGRSGAVRRRPFYRTDADAGVR